MKKLFLFCLLIVGDCVPSFSQGIKGGVSQVMSAGRIVDGEELTTLAELPYRKDRGTPFTILLLPKNSENVKEVEVIKGKYYQGDTTKNIPINIAVWSSVSLYEIDVDNPTIFVNYYVYIGFGQDVPGL